MLHRRQTEDQFNAESRQRRLDIQEQILGRHSAAYPKFLHEEERHQELLIMIKRLSTRR
jgi:hypothetical protein